MRCRHCHTEIVQINYGSGPVWMHHDPDFPYPYQICKPAPLAEPTETVGEWAAKVFGPLNQVTTKEK